jgi:hypothetical protein
MIKLILLALCLLLLLVGGLAVALFHFWGWKGMVAFPFIVIVLVWAGKVVIGTVFKRLSLALFSMKAGVLRGASMTVASVTPVQKPAESLDEEDSEEGSDEEDEAGEAGKEEHRAHAKEAVEGGEASGDKETEEQKSQYYAVEMTVTPSDKGRPGVWEPGEFILAAKQVKSLADLEQEELGVVEGVQVWNGSEFGPDEEVKYAGEQRLKVTFAVKPGTPKVWVHYYNEPLGELALPPWEPATKA